MNWLHKDFLQNDKNYLQAQDYWKQLFERSLPESFKSRQVEIHFLRNEDNDGNPIFSAACLSLELAVRVIQEPIGDLDDIDLDFWTDTVHVKPDVEFQELVISSCPSHEKEHEVRRILECWWRDGRVDEVREWDDRNFFSTRQLISSPRE